MSDEEKKGLDDELNDDQIREWFNSRDPNRKRIDPFLTEDAREDYSGRASPLTVREKDPKEKVYGVSYTQHRKHIASVARHFAWIGISIGLFAAIIVKLLS